MPKLTPLFISVCIVALVTGCSRKTQPSRTTTEPTKETIVVKKDTTATVIMADSLAVKKEPVKRKPKPATPKVITVNDNAAKKSLDGRLYYDLDGHRYWRSNKDGKYYLYNKSMNTDPNFKKAN